MSVMSCNGRHSDKKLVNQSKSVMSCNIRHGDCVCVIKLITLTELRKALHVKHCGGDYTDGTQINITHAALNVITLTELR